VGVLGLALAWRRKFRSRPSCWKSPPTSLGVDRCRDRCRALRRGSPFHRAAVARARGATKIGTAGLAGQLHEQFFAWGVDRVGHRVEPTGRGWVSQQVEIAILTNIHIDETFLVSIDIERSIETTRIS